MKQSYSSIFNLLNDFRKEVGAIKEQDKHRNEMDVEINHQLEEPIEKLLDHVDSICDHDGGVELDGEGGYCYPEPYPLWEQVEDVN